MQIGILCKSASWYGREIRRAAEERGHRCRFLKFETLFSKIREGKEHFTTDDFDLAELDAVLVRTMPPGSLEQVVFRMDYLARLEAAGMRVLNSPKAIECAVDKYLATSRFLQKGLHVPDTATCETAEEAMKQFQDFGGDVVVKPIFGSEGRGLLRVSDSELAYRTFRTLEKLQAVIYLQRFLPHDFDMRVLTLNGKILGAMKRFGNDDFRTNVTQQGRAELYAPTDEECFTALKAAETTGTTFAGVDLLRDGKGTLYTIEVNAVPGWRAFEKVNDCVVAEKLINYLET